MTPEPTSAAAARLDTRLGDLVAELRSLGEEFNSRDLKRARLSKITFIGVMLGVVIIVITLIVAIQNRSIAVDARSAAQAAKQASDRIQDCTTPNGKCYQDGTKRTGGAVGNIIKAQLLITECDRDNPGNDARFQSCVATKMKAAFPPTPAPATPPKSR